MAYHRDPDLPSKLDHAPMALTSTGAVVVNAAHLLPADNIHELLDLALAMGRRVFLGVLLHDSEVREALGRIDDAASEIVETVVGI